MNLNQKLKKLLQKFFTKHSRLNTPKKCFKRDSQRGAFLQCVGFCDYIVMRKVGSSVGCP